MARSDHLDTTTLSTRLEENFISPLTAVRGALEILRDYPELDAEQRARFVTGALDECARLERGVEELASAVYAAGRQTSDGTQSPAPEVAAGAFGDRLKLDAEAGIVEIDFSDFVFNSAATVNDVFDTIEAVLHPTAQRWYFVTNFRDCRVWPEAWVAFAHRGKKIAVNHALGTVRYAEVPADQPNSKPSGDDPDICHSRAEAMAQVAKMKSQNQG